MLQSTQACREPIVERRQRRAAITLHSKHEPTVRSRPKFGHLFVSHRIDDPVERTYPCHKARLGGCGHHLCFRAIRIDSPHSSQRAGSSFTPWHDPTTVEERINDSEGAHGLRICVTTAPQRPQLHHAAAASMHEELGHTHTWLRPLTCISTSCINDERVAIRLRSKPVRLSLGGVRSHNGEAADAHAGRWAGEVPPQLHLATRLTADHPHHGLQRGRIRPVHIDSHRKRGHHVRLVGTAAQQHVIPRSDCRRCVGATPHRRPIHEHGA
mmetsp:Transcript_17734/g.56845  ORF Transcript_17734/g.56845 Transcript_17734/m.56845 type:complete len:269 (+) Transcript_17734:298-1104(+)